jgi:hypothetical protein
VVLRTGLRASEACFLPSSIFFITPDMHFFHLVRMEMQSFVTYIHTRTGKRPTLRGGAMQQLHHTRVQQTSKKRDGEDGGRKANAAGFWAHTCVNWSCCMNMRRGRNLPNRGTTTVLTA